MKKFLLGIVVLLLILGCQSKDVKDSFNQNIKNINSDTVLLNDLTDFSWDELYWFAPYTSKDEKEKILGFNSDQLKDTVNDEDIELVFVKNHKIVLYINGNPDKLGYSFGLTSDIIHYDDHITLNIEKTDKVIYLYQM